MIRVEVDIGPKIADTRFQSNRADEAPVHYTDHREWTIAAQAAGNNALLFISTSVGALSDRLSAGDCRAGQWPPRAREHRHRQRSSSRAADA
jgi:hypothetical protein